MAPLEDQNAVLRSRVYGLLICLSVGVMLGRIFAVDAVDRTALEKDRLQRIPRDIEQKRVELKKQGIQGEKLEKALADREAKLRAQAVLRRPFLSANDRSRWCTIRALVEPEMRVEGVPYAIDKVTQQPGWDTIDMVKHDGHLYSSKPPLYPTLLAGIYWAIHHGTGMSFETHPFVIVRLMLVLVNVLPLTIGLFILARLVERFGTTDFGRLFVMASATFGTFLTTFAVVLNNHVIAAVCCILFLYCVVRIWFDGERRWRNFWGAGLAGAFLAANELPALSLFAVLSLALLVKAPKQTLAAYVPALLVVIVPFFATNYIAHDSLRLPYMHRGEGDNWYDYEYVRNGRVVQSYWNHPSDIDRGEPSVGVYAFQVLVGHHGIFSLTPIWILSIFGVTGWLFRSSDRKLREMAFVIALITLVCVTFYIFRPLNDRNYGGVTCGFRWVFWMAPLWLISILPVADRFSEIRWLRNLALMLLAASVLSVSYPLWNPWTQPWIVDLSEYLGWIRPYR